MLGSLAASSAVRTACYLLEKYKNTPAPESDEGDERRPKKRGLPITADIGRRIVELVEERKLSQRETALLLNVSFGTVNAVVHGRHSVCREMGRRAA